MKMLNGGITQGQVGKSLGITVHTISTGYPAILRVRLSKTSHVVEKASF